MDGAVTEAEHPALTDPQDVQLFDTVQSQDMYAMYRRFIEACHERGAALFTNYAVPMFNDMGYTELAGYFTYKQNWRNYAGRMMGQQALNRRGRPLIVVGTARRSDQYPYPPSSLGPDIVPFVVHSPLMHNVRMSLHPASQNDPDRQNRFANRIMQRWLEKKTARAYYRIRLDPIGSAVWLAIDGKRTVEKIGQLPFQ